MESVWGQMPRSGRSQQRRLPWYALCCRCIAKPFPVRWAGLLRLRSDGHDGGSEGACGDNYATIEDFCDRMPSQTSLVSKKPPDSAVAMPKP